MIWPQDVGNIELLAMRLPELAGSPLSINSIREDLQVSHKAASGNKDFVDAQSIRVCPAVNFLGNLI